MATRRTTRRSVAASGNENDLAARGAAPSLAGAAGKKVVTATKVTTRSKPAVVITKSANPTTTATAATRKRSAFADVTNGTKGAKGSTSSAVTKKPTLASSTTTRRTIRTRSSTGGAASEEPEPKEEDEEEEEEEEEDENAMVLDNDPAPAPAARQIKSLRKPASTTATKPRAALGNKSTNGAGPIPTTGRASAKPSVAARLSTTEKARVRRERAQREVERAEKELAEAQEEEERLQRRAKKPKTSEPDFVYEEDEDDEVEDEVALDVKTGGRDEGWDDLDDGDEEDPLMVAAYVVEVYEYLRELELTTMPDPDYMSNQNEVTWKMRGILVDWLVEIHTKFRLLPETIFLAVNIIDRFLSQRVVSLVKLQLVGVTALFVASKYEEVVCPSVSNFLYMTDGGYQDDEILKAERYILNMIDFNLSYPNPINFLRRISKADGYDIQSRTMAKYLMEISIVDHKFMGVAPSLIAAAGNWLARRILGKGAWDANLVHYSGYTEEELKPAAQLMLDYVVRNSTLATNAGNPLQTEAPANEAEHPNFTKKYAAKKFFRASTAVQKWAETEFRRGPALL